jgi:hypothetical protein
MASDVTGRAYSVNPALSHAPAPPLLVYNNIIGKADLLPGAGRVKIDVFLFYAAANLIYAKT